MTEKYRPANRPGLIVDLPQGWSFTNTWWGNDERNLKIHINISANIRFVCKGYYSVAFFHHVLWNKNVHFNIYKCADTDASVFSRPIVHQRKITMVYLLHCGPCGSLRHAQLTLLSEVVFALLHSLRPESVWRLNIKDLAADQNTVLSRSSSQKCP